MLHGCIADHVLLTLMLPDGMSLTSAGGGHSYEAMSLINNGLVLDLGKMDWMVLSSPSKRMISNPKNATSGNSGSTSPATPTLLVGPGARMGPIYTYLYKHGLMLEGSTCPTVGVSGLAQGKEVTAMQHHALVGALGSGLLLACQQTRAAADPTSQLHMFNCLPNSNRHAT